MLLEALRVGPAAPPQYSGCKHTVRPILLHLPFGYPLYAYGFMLTVSVIVGRWLAIRLAGRAGIDRKLADHCATWTLVGAIVGCRLLYVVTNLDQFEHVLDVFAWWRGGVVAYGGFLGGLVAAIVYCRIHGIPLLAWADCVVPSMCVGLAITRVGCFLGGCDFGRVWDGPWAVQFPVGSPAFLEHRSLGLLSSGAAASLPVHPTQLYEALAGVVLLFAVWAVQRRRRASGYALAAFALGYGVLRYLIEIVRADPNRGAIGPWSTSQFIAIATCLAALALLFVLRRRPEYSESHSDRVRRMLPMRDFPKSSGRWPRIAWLLPLVLLVLPNCILDSTGYGVGDDEFNPGNTPRSSAIMCDIPKLPSRHRLRERLLKRHPGSRGRAPPSRSCRMRRTPSRSTSRPPRPTRAAARPRRSSSRGRSLMA